MGLSDSFRTEIDIKTIYDKDTFVRKYEPTGSVPIESLIPNLRNHYRITEEYKLLADFLTRKIVDFVLPYFDKYSSSKEVLSDRGSFQPTKAGSRHEMSWNLILYSELANRINIQASSILEAKIDFYTGLGLSNEDEVLNEIKSLQIALLKNDWSFIEGILDNYKIEVYKKLKLK